MGLGVNSVCSVVFGLGVCTKVLLMRKVRMLVVCTVVVLLWARTLSLAISCCVRGMWLPSWKAALSAALKACRLWPPTLIRRVGAVSVCLSLVLLRILISMLTLRLRLSVYSLRSGALLSVVMTSRTVLVLSMCVLRIR